MHEDVFKTIVGIAQHMEDHERDEVANSIMSFESWINKVVQFFNKVFGILWKPFAELEKFSHFLIDAAQLVAPWQFADVKTN